ncbi:nuclear transport factor 2 family protein [Baekduia soli]|uniref:Nuclear transport factor 2 family protein n=1 Tax=Baekduia soli TaxID=496014 RepID=A0A5B8U2E6_9ACTN|nr:nuclear transport factor 2 family protein [Baekduia soli]QEC47259.1 nuclear transport factor 2 family protein [Baekduia soli]
MDQLQRLCNIEEIGRVKHRYFRLMDEKRWDEWGDVFTEDCHFTVGAGDGPVETTIDGRENIVAFWRDALKDGLSLHHGHMPDITFPTESTAHALWTYEYYGELGPGNMVRIYGIYDDDFEQAPDGAWRIRRLHINRLRLDEVPS